MTVLVVTVVGVVVVDGLTKSVVTAHLVEGRLYPFTGGWGLRLVHNPRGAALRLSAPRAAVAWLVFAACVVALVAAARPGSVATAGLGLVLGGAAGNVLDRMRRGGVVDFVVARRWPVFNLADAAMVVGVLLAVAP
jgi:signal peptidase II